MRKFIITGATGHIGNNLVRYIREQEPTAEITALLRSPTSLLLGTDAEERLIDFEDDTALSSCIPKDSILIHLAAVIDLSDKKGEEMERVNVQLTKRLCRICLKNKAAFIYCGSVDGIYKADSGIITEPKDYFPEKIEGGYGKTKAAAAKYLLEVMKENPDFICSIILPSAVMGINDFKPSEVGRIILDCINGKPEFGMKGGYNFVNVKDVCYAIYNAAILRKKEQYIVCGENATVKELYGLINQTIGRKSHPIIIPDFLIKLLMPFVGVLNPITVKSLKEPHSYSCQKAADEMGLTVTPIDETVEETVKWFKDNIRRLSDCRKT